jgi:hypothetical protein
MCHLFLGSVVREKAVGENEPSLLVALDVVGPLQEPPPELFRGAHDSFRHSIGGVSRSRSLLSEAAGGRRTVPEAESPIGIRE